MKRVIYSLYVDVPAKEHYGQSKQRSDTVNKAKITVNAFKKHYKRLIESKQKYADAIGATFIMFENEKRHPYDLRSQLLKRWSLFCMKVASLTAGFVQN